ncbi:hypothetical protein F4X86_00140 [Candidatus Saccharibacteria bacterium]|nr:hypothetical protein [Candidatus Saccharibacteria bacterium]
MTKKKLAIISAIGLPLLLVVGLLALFLRGAGPAGSELIDAVSAEIKADCRPYARSKRYGSVYGICRSGGTELRIDDLSRSSEEQVARFKAAMRVSCYSALNGQTLRIDALEGEGLLISAYFLTDFADHPDLRDTRDRLTDGGRQTVLADICQGAESVGGGGVRFTPLAWSDLSGSAEALTAADIGCAENTFRLTDFGVIGLNCSSNVVALDLGSLKQRAKDAFDNGLEYLDSCPSEIRMKLVRLGGDTYAMTAPGGTDDLSRRLAAAGQKTEIIEFCLGTTRS